MTLRKEIKKPQRMDGENYESDNYDAGYNQACSDWEGFIKERLEILADRRLNQEVEELFEDIDNLIKELDVKEWKSIHGILKELLKGG